MKMKDINHKLKIYKLNKIKKLKMKILLKAYKSMDKTNKQLFKSCKLRILNYNNNLNIMNNFHMIKCRLKLFKKIGIIKF